MSGLSVGTVLATGLRLFARLSPRFLPVVAVAAAPALALSDAPGDERASTLASLAVLLLDVPLTAILTHAALADLRGEPAPVRTSVAAGLRRTPALLGTVLLVYLVTFALAVAMVAIPAGGAASGSLGAGAAVVLVMSALWATAVVALYTRWFVLAPVAVAERPGVGRTLDRSGELTRGARVRLAAVLIALAAAWVAAAALLHLAVGPSPVAGALLWIALSLVRTTTAAAAYHLLRADRDAASPEHLARVFD